MKPFIIGATIATVLACLGCAGLFMIGLIASPRANAPSGVQATQAPAVPQVDVTAATLFRAYRANEVAADAQYKDRMLRVTGAVVDIRRNFGKTTVTLRGGDSDFETVSVILADGQDAVAARLQRGMQVAAVGQCDGMTIVDPVVSDAVIQ